MFIIILRQANKQTNTQQKKLEFGTCSIMFSIRSIIQTTELEMELNVSQCNFCLTIVQVSTLHYYYYYYHSNVYSDYLYLSEVRVRSRQPYCPMDTNGHSFGSMYTYAISSLPQRCSHSRLGQQYHLMIRNCPIRNWFCTLVRLSIFSTISSILSLTFSLCSMQFYCPCAVYIESQNINRCIIYSDLI